MLPGTYQAKTKNGATYYRSSITWQNKHISLGSFSSEAQASSAYKEAARILKEPGITIDNVSSSVERLSFEKAVTLLNFRDNRMYIKNPIYLRSNYFEYYLTANYVLKFDIDDLFYYSSHKIQKRGGHLFVSEYGMQYNILSRYGIKNHAVAGRDYLFANDDRSDFRYSNIIVINPYQGVTKILTKNGSERYRTRIHINGDYLIGTYRDEITAAIAYNKAVDLAKKAGISIQYTANYIDSLSASEYAERYTKIRISPKFLKYLANLSV